jgi:hypothetical protein
MLDVLLYVLFVLVLVGLLRYVWGGADSETPRQKPPEF